MTRMDFLNLLTGVRGYTSYLEIGCDANRTFQAVRIMDKVGVDCRSGGTLRMTSDEFFEVNCRKFDLVFIDGWHTAEQVTKDVENSLLCLNTGGCIVLHDCLPFEEWHQAEQGRPGHIWTGDVWKAVVKFRARPDLDTIVFDRDLGLGVIFKRPNSSRLLEIPDELTWDLFQSRGKELLRVVGPPFLFYFISLP